MYLLSKRLAQTSRLAFVTLLYLMHYSRTKFEAHNLLEDLQETKVHRCEPALCPKPTQRALDIRFHFLLVGDKAYAIGSPVFDAQSSRRLWSLRFGHIILR